jgi:hypothetical protein
MITRLSLLMDVSKTAIRLERQINDLAVYWLIVNLSIRYEQTSKWDFIWRIIF